MSKINTINAMVKQALIVDLQGEIKWFEDLLESLKDGEYDVAVEAVDAALKLKQKELDEIV